MSQATRMGDVLGLRTGETVDAWCSRTFGPPIAHKQVEVAERKPEPSPRLRRASAALERSIPPALRWCRLEAPELAQRVYGPAIAMADSAWREDRLCMMGASRAGKTSLAVALLRVWVEQHATAALFVAAYKLSVARIQHPAGHGEAPLVEQAMRAPLILLDDLGSERDSAVNPIADVIFERHAQDLPTWVTTGLTREPLVARYGAGVVTRLFERARVIHLGAKKPSV